MQRAVWNSVEVCSFCKIWSENGNFNSKPVRIISQICCLIEVPSFHFNQNDIFDDDSLIYGV